MGFSVPPIDDFAAVVETFIERHAKANTRERTWKETERILRREILPRWRGRRLTDIRRPDVMALMDEIMDRGSPMMAGRVLAVAKRLASWALERGIIEVPLWAGIKPPAAPQSRDRILNDDELRAVWHAAKEIGWPAGPVIQVLALTAQRASEVSRMTWREVNFDSSTWSLPAERCKNGRAHSVPLAPQAVVILKNLPHVGTAGVKEVRTAERKD